MTLFHHVEVSLTSRNIVVVLLHTIEELFRIRLALDGRGFCGTLSGGGGAAAAFEDAGNHSTDGVTDGDTSGGL